MGVDGQELFLQIKFKHVLVQSLSKWVGCFHSRVVVVIEDGSLDGLYCIKGDGDDGLAVGRKGLLLVLIDSQGTLSDHNVAINVGVEVVEAELAARLGEQYGFYRLNASAAIPFLSRRLTS